MSSSQIQYDLLISRVSIRRLVDLPRRMFEKTTKTMIGSRMICIVICIIAVGAERSIDFLSLPSLPFCRFDWMLLMNTMHLYLSHRNSEFSSSLDTKIKIRVPRTSYGALTSPMKKVAVTIEKS